jgi:hypothetical protein
MKLTENEKTLLSVIIASEYQDSDTPVNHGVWLDCITEDFEYLSELKGKSISGVFSSAVQKGLIYTDIKDNYVSISQKGYDLFIESTKDARYPAINEFCPELLNIQYKD